MAKPTAAPRPPERRATAVLLWLLLGLALGTGLGLAYAWLIAPVEFVNATPAELSAADQAAYVVLVSAGYATDGDLSQAQSRLAALDQPVPADTVARLLETAVREQYPAVTVRNLAHLARALGVRNATVAAFAPADVRPPAGSDADLVSLPTPGAAVATPAAATPAVTPQPVETAVRLVTQERVCDPPLPQIEIEVLDVARAPLAGAEIVVVWPGGRDRFYTGFKLERGPGYADFTMQPDVVYTVSIPDSGLRVGNLRIAPCESGAPGGWRLVFQRVEE